MFVLSAVKVLTICEGRVLSEEMMGHAYVISLLATSLTLLSPRKHALFRILCAGYLNVSRVPRFCLGIRNAKDVLAEGRGPGSWHYNSHGPQTGPTLSGGANGR